jgi:WD40 repeat protein
VAVILFLQTQASTEDTLIVLLKDYGYGPLTCIKLTPDGTKFITGSGDGKLRLWDAVTGSVVKMFNGHAVGKTSIAVSSDGSKILAGSGANMTSNGGTVKLWDVATAAFFSNPSQAAAFVKPKAFRP